MKKIFFFVLFAVMTVSLFGATLNDVQKLAAQGKFAESVSACNEILKQKPGNVNVLRWLAYNYYKIGNYDAVIELKNQTSKDSEICNYIGLAYVAQKKNAEAKQAFSDAIMIDKNFSEAYKNNADIYIEEKDFATAKSYLLSALSLCPDDVNILINMAYVNIQLKEYDNALNHLQKAKSLSPNNKTVLCNLGNTYCAKNDYANAIKAFESLYSLDKNSTEAISGLANAYALCSKNAEAEKYYNMLLKKNDSFEINYNMGVVLRKQGKFGKAVSYFEKAVSQNPEDMSALCELAWSQFKSGNAKSAEENLDKVLAKDKNNLSANTYIAVIYDSEGNVEKSYSAWSQCVILAPQNPDYNINLGKACINSGKFKEAVSAYTNALKYDKNSEIASLGLGVAKLQESVAAGDAKLLNEALIIFKNITAKNPKNAVAWSNLGVCYQKNKKYTEAAEAYKKALVINPNFEEAKANLKELEAFAK